MNTCVCRATISICLGASWFQSRLMRGLGQLQRSVHLLGSSRPSRKWAAGLRFRQGRKPQVGLPLFSRAPFPLPQGFPAQRMTTSCGHRLMTGATSVCWDTRPSSSAGLPMPRALMERTSTGLWSCPIAPAPGRTMNGWFFFNAWGLSCVSFTQQHGKQTRAQSLPRGKAENLRKQICIKHL